MIQNNHSILFSKVLFSALAPSRLFLCSYLYVLYVDDLQIYIVNPDFSTDLQIYITS